MRGHRSHRPSDTRESTFRTEPRIVPAPGAGSARGTTPLNTVKRNIVVAIALAALIVIGGCRSGSSTAPAGSLSRTGAHHRLGDAPATAVLSDPYSSAREATIRPWTFGMFEGRAITTPHYNIYTTVEYDSVVDDLPLFLEYALGVYCTDLAELPPPTERMETYLFQDRRQWTAKTRQFLPDYAETFDNLGRGGYSTRGTAVLYYIDYRRPPRDTFAIAAHEGWHQYTQSTFRNPLPIWLEEGIATYMEGCRLTNDEMHFNPRWNAERWGALSRALARDRLIPLDELLREPPQTFLKQNKQRLLVYYAQVWALVHFLVEGGEGTYRAALEKTLVDASDGELISNLARSPVVLTRGGRRAVLTSRTGPWLILAYFNGDLDDFEAEYLAYIGELAGEGKPHARRRHRGRR
jgi:hypothetical protein